MRTLREIDGVPVAHSKRSEGRNHAGTGEGRTVAGQALEECSRENPPENIAASPLLANLRRIIEALEVRRVDLYALTWLQNDVQKTGRVRQVPRGPAEVPLALITTAAIEEQTQLPPTRPRVSLLSNGKDRRNVSRLARGHKREDARRIQTLAKLDQL